MLRTTRFLFFFDRQQEYALKSAKKEEGGGGRPMYTGYVHRKNPNTPHTKMVHTNK